MQKSIFAVKTIYDTAEICYHINYANIFPLMIVYNYNLEISREI